LNQDNGWNEHLQPNQQIYFTPSFGMTGHLCRVLQINGDNITILINNLTEWMTGESNRIYNCKVFYGNGSIEVTVPRKYVYSEDFLDDW
jgi:hypothetical protein